MQIIDSLKSLVGKKSKEQQRRDFFSANEFCACLSCCSTESLTNRCQREAGEIQVNRITGRQVKRSRRYEGLPNGDDPAVGIYWATICSMSIMVWSTFA
jgi:hypothetical protein